jgi:electron transport complex protein RnfG
MKEMLQYGLTLMIICAVATGLLAGVNSFTKLKIIAQAQAEQDAGLKEVMPEATNFEAMETNGEVVYYKVYKNDVLLGAAFKATAKGYSSEIQTMVGMTKDGQITAIKVLSQNETPGLGSRITEPSFTGQFANKSVEGLNEISAITGATISSTAVMNSVKARAEEIFNLIKNGK